MTVAVIVLALLGALAGPQVRAQRPSGAAGNLARGEQLYGRSCASCHGPAGEGGKGPTLAVPRLFRAADRKALAVVIRRGIEGSEMPGARLSEADARLLADYVLGFGRRPREPMPGDPQRGARLYRDKGGCASCHTIKGEGGAFGPDLTDIGRRRGAAHLRQSLLEPNADMFKGSSIYRSNISITENFLHVRVTAKDGRQLQGVRVNEDTFSIQLRDLAGTLHSLLKSELDEVHKDWGQSPMPAYRHVFSVQELDDVVAFMLTLRGA